MDCFQLILMGFLTTSLHKNSQNNVKLLETWWFWYILGNGTHIYSNQKHPDFHQKSPWTPMSQLSPVWQCWPNVRFCIIKSAHHRTSIKWLWSLASLKSGKSNSLISTDTSSSRKIIHDFYEKTKKKRCYSVHNFCSRGQHCRFW